jgi:hypothetical protein
LGRISITGRTGGIDQDARYLRIDDHSAVQIGFQRADVVSGL